MSISFLNITQATQSLNAHSIQHKRLQPNQQVYFERKKRKYNETSPENSVSDKASPTFAPALTAHPTNPLGFMFQIVQYALSEVNKLEHKQSELSTRKDIKDEEKPFKTNKLNQKIKQFIQKNNKILPKDLPVDIISIDLPVDITLIKESLEERLKDEPIIASKPLTPDQEVDLGLNIFYTEIFTKSTSIIRHKLQDGLNTENLFDLHTWSGGDADGNKNVTPQVTRDTVKKHAQKAAELYKDDILLAFPDAPQELIQQCEDITKGKGDVTNTTENLHIFLDKEIANASDKASPAHVLKAKLHDFPLTGAKLDIRQSSEATDETLRNIITDVLGHSSEMAQAVTTLGNAKRTEFLENLLKNEEDLNKIANFVKEKGLDSFIELDRMLAVQENPATIERVRISDGRDANDVRTLRIFEKVAQKILGIPEKPTTDFIVLAETEQDIVNLPKIAKDVLESKLNLDGKLTLFPGYSDAEKRMGLTGLLTISKALTDTINVVNDYANKTETKIKLTISHGGGEDITRNGGKIKPDSTKQGREGIELALGDNFKQELQLLDNKEDSVYSQAKEMQTILDTPELQEAMGHYITVSRIHYRTMVEHAKPEGNHYENTPITALGDVTAQALQGKDKWFYNLVKQGNKSSRAGAKSSSTPTKLNLDKERAIGLASLFTASGTGAQVLSGLPRHSDIKPNVENLKTLFKTSSVMQDIIFKSLYTSAITDFNRASLIAGLNEPLLPKDVLTYTNAKVFSPVGTSAIASNDSNNVLFYTQNSQIKTEFDNGNHNESAKLWLENNLRHAVDATRAMIDIVSENDDALKTFDNALKDGKTLAEATQDFLSNSEDNMLKALGEAAKDTVQKAGLPFTNILKKYSHDLGKNDIQDGKIKQAQDAALLLIREEQTVPKILREFASMSDKKDN